MACNQDAMGQTDPSIDKGAQMIKYYKVGGCVRDEMLGVRSKDIDYAVEAESFEAMRDDLVIRGAQIFLEKPEYLTIRAMLGREAADFVLCRKDGAYSDARRPDTVQPGTIYDDLARRDFTVNAMAEESGGRILDPHGGQTDLRNRTLRCVGSAEIRMSEDALRLLRAIRFIITKELVADIELHNVLIDSTICVKVGAVSTDRIRDELNKCFAADTFRTIRLLDKYHILRDGIFALHPGLSLEATSRQR